ncbi:MAG: hypothetical protein FWD34_09770 [Oscillospiraceae bacterium]|nr:hypothetical protein [Oscillospiraceae bacterium]
MSFNINRKIIHIKNLSEDTSAPSKMAPGDFETLLNFFRRINDEIKAEGSRLSNETLAQHNIQFFCLSSGAVMFKIIENPLNPGGDMAEIYGFFIPLSDVRTAWLDIDKLCMMLAVEAPGSAESGELSYEKLCEVDTAALRQLSATFRNSLREAAGKLVDKPFPESFAVSCLPKIFFPDGVNIYENGFFSSTTDGSVKEKVIELDDRLIADLLAECKEPLKSAVIMCVANESDDSQAEEKKGGLFKMFKKNSQSLDEAKAIKQWRYEFISNLQRQSENCDFIIVDKPIEYSPIMDTFNAYTGKVGTDKDDLPSVPSARIYMPKPAPTSIAPMSTVAQMNAVAPAQNAAPAFDFSQFTSSKPQAPITGIEPMLSSDAMQAVSALEVKPTPKLEPMPTIEPMQTFEPVKPPEPVKPAPIIEPMQTIEPVKPPEPVKPAPIIEPMQTFEQIKPPEPVKPAPTIEPMASVEPMHTGDLMQAVEPISKKSASSWDDFVLEPSQPAQPEPISQQTDFSLSAGMDFFSGEKESAPLPKPFAAMTEAMSFSDKPDFKPTNEFKPGIDGDSDTDQLEAVSSSLYTQAESVQTAKASRRGWDDDIESDSSPLPPPPAPVTVPTEKVWASTMASVEKDDGTSGEMDAVMLEPDRRASTSTIMDMYYKSLQNNQNKNNNQ